MVQFFKGSPDPRDAAYGQLASALGQGIGNGLNTYFANRSLDSVLNDKSLEEAPQSQKMEELSRALSPYGQKGKEIFQQRMQIEQQAQQEKEQKNDLKKGDILRRRLSGMDISDKEKSLFTPQEELAIAHHEQAIELQNLKNQGAKSPGGVTAQPIPPEQINSIEQFIKDNPNSSSDELAIGLGKAGVNPIYSNPYIENRRRQEENKVKQNAAESKIVNSNDIKFHEESKEYADKIRKEAKTAKERLDTIAPIIKDVEEGKIKPTSAANIFRFFGKSGNKIADALLSGKEANLLAAIPEFLEGRKELFGVRLSDADLNLLQDKLPDIGKSPAANLKILGLMKKYAERALLREEAAENVLEKNGVNTPSGKLRPLNFENHVEREFDKILSEEENGILMKLPDGREVPIERSKVKEAENLGAKRLKK